MQKVSNERKQHILELLKKGENVRVLAQRYGIPLSTIRTWMSKSLPEKKERFYDDVLPFEAKIFSNFCPYLKSNVSDYQFEKLQKSLVFELNNLCKTIVNKVLQEKEST